MFVPFSRLTDVLASCKAKRRLLGANFKKGATVLPDFLQAARRTKQLTQLKNDFLAVAG